MTKPQRSAHDRLEEHSLPDTNQVGTGPGEYDAEQDEPREGTQAFRDEQRKEHSLPGTNQAGTGPGEEDDCEQP